MAINPSTNTTMAGRVTAADLDYPYGSSKNETSPGAGDGTPYFKARADDLFGFQQALLKACGIVPSGNADTALDSQYMQADTEIAAGRAINYDESGVADAYVLDLRANQQGPASYFDGLRARFTTANLSTGGACTVDIAGLGSKSIKRADGTDPAAGQISGKEELEFDLANNWFELLPGAASQVIVDAGLDNTDFVTPLKMRFGFAISLGETGYITFPTWMGGLIIQWGKGTTPAGPLSVIFPITFPTITPVVSVAVDGNATGNVETCQYLNTNPSSMDIIAATTVAVIANVNWIAIGY